MGIKFGSVCSGIEAASVAWEPLGLSASWLSEIEPFPCALLHHHWPNVPNLGDMMEIKSFVTNGLIDAPDILVGGTPCQAFSVAGLRKGLGDDRGHLTLEFVRIANDIDKQRPDGEGSIIVWENVPGVLSSEDNAFGCFLAGLAGDDFPLDLGERPERGKTNETYRWHKDGHHVPKWPKSGLVCGPQRSIAWRVLDAQYFGVAQRRRRLFIVASSRNGFDPGQVLFESEGVPRDTPPSREARQKTSNCITSGVGNADRDAQNDNLINQGWDAYQHHNWRASDTTGTLTANLRKGVCGDTPLVSRFAAGFSAGNSAKVRSIGYTDEGTPPIRSGASGTNQVPTILDVQTIPINDKATRHAGKTGKGSGNGLGIGKEADPSPTLTAGDKHAVCIQGSMIGRGDKAGPQGSGLNDEVSFTQNTTDRHAVAFTSNGNGRDSATDLSPTVRVGGHSGNPPAVAFSSKDYGGAPPAVAFAQNSRNELREKEVPGGYPAIYAFDSLSSNSMKSKNPDSGCREVDLHNCLDTSHNCPSKNQGGNAVMANGVRRLTPLECERLQGFPDNHTLIPYGAKQKLDRDKVEYYERILDKKLTEDEARELVGDGARYKAIGNSMAVPVMRWIGQRIKDQLEATK